MSKKPVAKKEPAKQKSGAVPRALATQSAVNSAVWSISDIMRRSNSAGAMQYVPELMKVRERGIRALETKTQLIEDAAHDLKAVTPAAKPEGDTRRPAELLDSIEAKVREITGSLAHLRDSITTIR